jgi:addiction module HigA family antidote
MKRTYVSKDPEGFRLQDPAHPGRLFGRDVLPELGLSIRHAAAHLGVTRYALAAFINGRKALSPDMAIRLSKAFGVSMELLMRMQNAYDIAQARKRMHEIDVKPVRVV